MDFIDSDHNNTLASPECSQQEKTCRSVDGIDGEIVADNARPYLEKTTSKNEVDKRFENKVTQSESRDNLPNNRPALERDSIDSDQSSLDYISSQKQGHRQYNIGEVQDMIDRRIAEARLEVVENKIDRISMSLQANNKNDDQQRQLFEVLLARIKELEDKLEKKATLKKGNRAFRDSLSELPLDRYSSYVVEKATQTPSEEHECEGVFVLVSMKNKQQVRKVHRQVAFVLQEESNDKTKSEEFYPYPGQRRPQTTVKKVMKQVGYPEYVYEESERNIDPNWNEVVRRSIAFLPPIPDPYAKRRPRNTKN